MELKESLRGRALEAGFVRVRFLAPFAPEPAAGALSANYGEGAPSLLTAALVYGNSPERGPLGEAAGYGDAGLPAKPPSAALEGRAYIAPFARRNFYREAVKRLQELSQEFRSRFGGKRSGFRILCNSPLPEKPLALASGLGVLGRNGLILTPEAGSLFIIAAMTLPYALEGDPPGALPEDFPFCGGCDPHRPPCAAACPTGALPGDGTLERGRCIQWYASGHGETVPPEVARYWGNRLYGCTACQDACVWNRRPIQGVESREGLLPAFFDTEDLLSMDDGELRARFKGAALGLSWLGPEAIRRNARLAAAKGGSVGNSVTR